MVKVVVTRHALKRLAQRGGHSFPLEEALEKGTLVSREKDGSLLIHNHPFFYALERDSGANHYVLVTVYTGVSFGLWKSGRRRLSEPSPLKQVKVQYPGAKKRKQRRKAERGKNLSRP